ncbi:hypothetical protein Pyn_34221 [Prunus yedoensis var. nudiflora]|uniref:Uncharacterized protein n=1 Tax=Prunus yedoensis var. nudiflora TaxID=2094558 RepID=A0A314UY96_PRUYE|nr:hypothetical protein Pyn_34221 [Prunus yedoensis var. nudiflora]
MLQRSQWQGLMRNITVTTFEDHTAEVQAVLYMPRITLVTASLIVHGALTIFPRVMSNTV